MGNGKIQKRFKFMKPQLIIPMSGVSKRFSDKGYQKPKFLLDILGKPMINHVVEIFKGWENILFVVNEDHLLDEELKLFENLTSIAPNSKIFPIKPHKKGPAWAILQAKDVINLESPVVVNYCDFGCLLDVEALTSVINSDLDGTIITYSGFHPHMLRSTQFAYVKKDVEGFVIDIKEKESFTDNPMEEEASSGTYGFKSGKLLIDSILDQINSDFSFNSEYYISLTYKSLLKNNLKIKTQKIDYFMQWGTPEDFEDFNFWSKSFQDAAIKKHKSINSKKIILAAGESRRFKAKNYLGSKALLPIGNASLIQQQINYLGSTNTTCALRSSQLDLKSELNRIGVKYIEIQNLTRGQAESAKFAIDKLKKDEPLFIGPCDVIMGFSEYDDINNFDADLIVWIKKNVPYTKLQPGHFGWVKSDSVSDEINDVLIKKIPPNFEDWAVITGAFSFKSTKVFSDLLDSLIKNEITINNEFYIDSVIELAIKKNLKVYSREPDVYFSLGTPDEFAIFNYWKNCFEKWSSHPYNSYSTPT